MSDDDKPNTSQRSESRLQREGRKGAGHRLKRLREQGLKPPISPHGAESAHEVRSNYVLDCGWGRLAFGQTFHEADALVGALREERGDTRDIAIYVRDPHVLLASAPNELFLDPSHTFRLNLPTYRVSKRMPKGYFIRRLTSREDAQAINRIYASRSMVQISPDFFWSKRDARVLTYFVAEDERTGDVIGTVTGVDHARAFGDPERGSSLWCLAVDAQARHPGIGEALVRRLAEFFQARQAAYMDLSVLHDNEQAIKLYEKLGFQRVPYFAVKRKNHINENLFTGGEAEEGLNPYAQIIVKEARRRGIHVEIIDAEGGLFRLTQGGVSVRCRESLSELTSAVAMSICDDKTVTRRTVARAGVRVPAQIMASAGDAAVADFVAKHGAVVVKPARGEQGRGISIGLTQPDEVREAIKEARQHADSVIIEEMVRGKDLRLVVINYRLVAAAIRLPPKIIGDGRSNIRELIEAQSRRRSAATGGESEIPIDAETERTLLAAGRSFEDVLESNEELTVRKAANLHTGGTIHDVTDIVHPHLVEAAVLAARAIDIPVCGIDLMVTSPRSVDYAFIEANERPGLANHEPQPTAERFIDLLFPLSMPLAARQALRKNLQAGRTDEPSDD
ncbi:N-acetylglutaminylglutamine synthetase [Pseudohoeflea coraliihabitans]|uniref:N-acetylglutaminylglutamine synthetase n=1 Tax=Pseudohoeflea coraliihabitans TaxID=2860393 RepID=A0ABS6WS83_9HYPH|nr:N-acetylglutaminylglutamine synthetase [Pseudohoeflea sp. DP4N28-3]MBW3097935.1 N-acetylglutaminylglutamine synthetase [Pseudohoeflea sp. DP4N28-3]